MSPLKYIQESKCCTTKELLDFKREDSKGFETFLEMARAEMQHNGVDVTATLTTS